MDTFYHCSVMLCQHLPENKHVHILSYGGLSINLKFVYFSANICVLGAQKNCLTKTGIFNVTITHASA